MPSPRAVLADIHDHDLDPTVSYEAVNKKGRIVPSFNKPEQKKAPEPQLEPNTQIHVVPEPQVIFENTEIQAITVTEERVDEQPVVDPQVLEVQEEDLSKLNKKQKRKIQ